MKNKTSKMVLRILTAVCFLWILVNGAISFISGRIYESGDIITIVLALLPVIAGIVIIIGALTDSHIVIGLGAVIYLIPMIYSVYTGIQQLQSFTTDEMKAHMRGLIISSGLIILAFLFLALACFDKKRDLAFCVFSAALFVAWFFVRRSYLSADDSQLSIILTAAGSVIGTILIGFSMVLRRRKKEE